MTEEDVVAVPVVDQPSTRDRILTAALDAFADRGVEATSLDAVAAELGIRKQTILYWFPSKEQLLLDVVDHAVDELGRIVSDAARSARSRTRSGSGAADESPHVPTLADRLTAVVDATFRLGTTRPQLLAVLREVTRLGPPGSTRLASAVEPLAGEAAEALGRPADQPRLKEILLAASARVVGLATEAEVRTDLGLAPDLAWLRRSRQDLIKSLLDSLLPGLNDLTRVSKH
ncbi:MAG: TetR/AcrR family transcriptional regulator [Acidimicrobiales bacterium]|nr:TetR/AcrR family transcriptional regulator [Acidimicrobiales bacterium]